MSTTLRVLTCPLEANYHFYNVCPINCLYNSNRCKNNCIQLSTSQFSEHATLSASEILYYKGNEFPKYTVKKINKLKKEGAIRIQNLYVFNFYLEYLRSHYFEYRQSLERSEFDKEIKSTRILNIFTRYPFNIPLFKLNITDLVLLLTESFYEEYCKKKKVNPETRYEDVMCLTEIKIFKARKVLTKYLNRKEITHELSTTPLCNLD
jgi:hypothetical protein